MTVSEQNQGPAFAVGLGQADAPIAQHVHELQARLSAAQAQLFAVTNCAPLILWSLDADGKVTMSEGAGLKALGLDPGQLVGMYVQDVYQEYPEALEGIRRGLAGEEFSLEVEVGGAWWENRYFPTFSESGEVLGLVGISLDVTSRKQAEHQAREEAAQTQHAQKLESLGVLAGGIAHDFNNLLTGMLSHAEAALGVTPRDGAVALHLEGVIRSVDRAADLCRQLLVYAGKGERATACIDPGTEVRAMTEILRASISKRVRLSVMDDEAPPIEIDPTQWQQIVMNLILNASEAVGDQDGEIALITRGIEFSGFLNNEWYFGERLRPGLYSCLEVHDTGLGMDRQVAQRMFDPFFTTKAKGRGLGLSTVLKIIRDHRGALSVESAVGSGTTMRVYLPAGDSAARPIAADVPAELALEHGSGAVLVIDDEQLVRDAVRSVLETAGYEVSVAADGRAGTMLLRQNPNRFIAAIVDMAMPIMNGAETVVSLRSVSPHLPVLLCSGYDEHDLAPALTNGTNTKFIPKPFRAGELISVLQSISQSSHAGS